MTDAVITAGPGEETEAEEAKRAIDEKAYGFWIYLMIDAIIFALLLATFVVMSHNTADGPGGHTLFRLPHTFAQTMLLLASSTTFGFASVAIAAGQRSRTLAWLGVTFLLGLGFVAMEISEFYGMAVAGGGPWSSGFLSAFFTLVGTHGTHVSIGLVWIVLLGCEVALRGLNPFVASRVYRLGLFWHFLVIVWISIFSVVYLPGILQHAGSAAIVENAELPHGGEITIKPYLVGVVLALVLTVIPFGLVAARTLRPIQILAVIGVAAIVQVVVHLRYFLHLDLKPSSQNKLIALCFAAVVLLILAGGTLWILFDSITA